MRLALVLGVIGRLLGRFWLAFLPPMILAIADGEQETTLHFAASAAITMLLAWLLATGYRRGADFRRSEALAVVAGTWLLVALVAAMPYVSAGLPAVDAYFEAMSGLTTTGATILSGETWEQSRAFFLWRAMTQWFGGVGVIALFVVVLPQLGVGGRQLFFAEASSAPGEAVSPKIRSTALRLWVLYVGLTALQAVLLAGFAGMPLYDSILHALTTMCAGGFSPNPESIAGYAGMEGYRAAAGEWIFIVFMMVAGLSFPLLYVALTRRPWELLRDGEFLFYLLATAAVALVLAGVLQNGFPNLDALRVAAFQCASLISSTGYASTDYNLWADAGRVLLVVVMLVGGCAGSAAGGAKAGRHLLTLKFIYREMTRVIHPRAVIPLRHKKKTIPDAIMRAVLTVVALYGIGYVVVGVILVLLGTDFVTSFSAALACLGNIGPGFESAGPMGTYAGFPPLSKLVLTAAMWFGRLEIVTVVALLHPDVLSRARWTGGRQD